MSFFPLCRLALVAAPMLAAACAGTPPPPASPPPQGSALVEAPASQGGAPATSAHSSDPGSRWLPPEPMGAVAVETEPRPPRGAPPHPPFSRPAAPLQHGAPPGTLGRRDASPVPAPPRRPDPPPEPPSWDPPAGRPGTGAQTAPPEEDAAWPPTRPRVPPATR